MSPERVDAWVEALVQRHTSSLSRPEFLKAIRALSARYVERRSELTRRSAIDSAGKRAAFAAFFAPLHFLTTSAIVQELGAAELPLTHVLDLGCGTGVASAAWATTSGQPVELAGVDRHPWSLDEAQWNWRFLGLRGRTSRGDMVRTAHDLSSRPARPGTSIVAAWSLNELENDARSAMQQSLLTLSSRGCRILVIEPLARTAVPWWDEWTRVWSDHGGDAREWKLERTLPAMLSELSEAAGFRREALSARSLWIDGTR